MAYWRRSDLDGVIRRRRVLIEFCLGAECPIPEIEDTGIESEADVKSGCQVQPVATNLWMMACLIGIRRRSRVCT